jgi:hypothetical protein
VQSVSALGFGSDDLISVLLKEGFNSALAKQAFHNPIADKRINRGTKGHRGKELTCIIIVQKLDKV